MSREKKDQSEDFSDEPEMESPFSQPVVVPIEDSIDLHAFSPKDIPSVVE